jgi:hypothetical protein
VHPQLGADLAHAHLLPIVVVENLAKPSWQPGNGRHQLIRLLFALVEMLRIGAGGLRPQGEGGFRQFLQVAQVASGKHRFHAWGGELFPSRNGIPLAVGTHPGQAGLRFRERYRAARVRFNGMLPLLAFLLPGASRQPVHPSEAVEYCPADAVLRIGLQQDAAPRIEPLHGMQQANRAVANQIVQLDGKSHAVPDVFGD